MHHLVDTREKVPHIGFIYSSALKEYSRRRTQTNTDISTERPARLKTVTATRRAWHPNDLGVSN